MDNPRKILPTAIACGVVLGLLGAGQVNTVPRPGPEMPFRWAQEWTPPTASMQFADSVPLDLDVPAGFQVRTAAIEGDPVDRGRAELAVPRADWAALRLAEYKVDAPRPLPEPESFEPEQYGASAGDSDTAPRDAAARPDGMTGLADDLLERGTQSGLPDSRDDGPAVATLERVG